MLDGQTTIIAVRHGETEWNVEGRWQGHFNSPLTDKGKWQAEALAKRLKAIDFNHLYSSDLGRAVETAKPIAALKGMEIKFEKRLREKALGIFEGMTREEMNLNYPEEYDLYLENNPDYSAPEGESSRQRFNRNIAALDEIALKHKGETVLIVIHGGVLDSIIRYVLNIPLDEPRRFSMKNASISVCTCSNGDWRLETWGDVSHLSGFTEDQGLVRGRMRK